MKTIIVDPAQLERVANRIETSNDEYKRTYEKLYTEVDKLSASWTGKDNLEFTNKIRSYQSDLRMISLILDQYQNFLRHSARAYQETQDELYSSAARLKIGGY